MQEAAGKQIADLQKRIADSETLLSLNDVIIRAKNKTELMALVRDTVTSIFDYVYCTICLVSDDKKSYRTYLLDQERRLTHYDSYEQLLEAPHDMEEGFFKKMFYSDVPLLFDLQAFREAGMLPAILHFTYDIGVRQTMGLSLRNNTERYGVITFYSENRQHFNESIFPIAKNIASQVSITLANIMAGEEIVQRNKERDILIAVSNEIVAVNSKEDLLSIISKSLQPYFEYTGSYITLYNPEKKTYKPYVYYADKELSENPEFKLLTEVDIPEYGPMEEHSHIPVIFNVDELLPSNDFCAVKLHSIGIKESIRVKLSNGNKQIGQLVLLSKRSGTYDKHSIELLQKISFQLSKAVANIIANEEIRKRDKENEMLLAVSYAISGIRDKQDLLNNVNTTLKEVLKFSDIAISIYNIEKQTYKVYLHDCPTMRQFTDFDAVAADEYPLQDGIHNLAVATEETVILSYEHLLKLNLPHIDFMLGAGIRELACIQLRNSSEIIGGMVLMSEQENCFRNQDNNLIKRVSLHLATALSNILANERIVHQLKEIQIYKEQLELEKAYLKSEVDNSYKYGDIAGSGPQMQKVFQLLSQVSQSSSTVLLLGETGTGKELVARAIHSASFRKEKLMVKVNCAALPANLIESELFGHERGAFTGALERRIGKFELANKGTLFLDEIGEMPLDLQVKLLRALQEKEIERVGGKAVIKTDVRIIAATNRDLQKEVSEGRFRMDLFYRLNVFPITLPPLRDRKEDIAVLALHFMDKYSKSNGRNITNISGKAMKEMASYHWPGNVRELEHLIERSILMTEGNIIRDIYLPRRAKDKSPGEKIQLHKKTLEEMERDYIISILNQCQGKVSGKGGAAEILDLNPSTLHSKMRKLGIAKDVIHLKQ